MSAFDPHAPEAALIADLGKFMIAVAAIVCIVVFIYLLAGLVRARRRTSGDQPQQVPPTLGSAPSSNAIVAFGGIVVPTIILLAVLGYTIYTLRAVTNSSRSRVQAASSAAPLTIEVIGHEWWWQVLYPHEQVTTANEVHIPVGQPVQLKVTTDDVIHSFWVPQLLGKIDLIPGRTNTVSLRADQPGVYRGQCAEYCGLQHAHMIFYVQADTPSDFLAWMNGQQRTPPEPTDSLAMRGQQVFLGSACVYCHTVQGTNAYGTLGPNLTHLASRRSIGAGTLENTPGNLAGWIEDSQSMKPGNKMPPMYLDGPDLQALLAYLESLK